MPRHIVTLICFVKMNIVIQWLITALNSMKYSVSTIRHLLALVNGEIVPDSKLRVDLFKQLEDDSLLIPIPHGGRKSWRAQNCEHLRFHLRDVYDLRDLEECLRISTIDNVE